MPVRGRAAVEWKSRQSNFAKLRDSDDPQWDSGPIFQVVMKEPQKLGRQQICFRILPGQLKAGVVTLKHPGITLEFTGDRTERQARLR